VFVESLLGSFNINVYFNIKYVNLVNLYEESEVLIFPLAELVDSSCGETRHTRRLWGVAVRAVLALEVTSILRAFNSRAEKRPVKWSNPFVKPKSIQ
tara:strand:+ start:514 stop:804 length:291 start_codon:yes stop_codon:yes gene_type:complete